MVRSDGQTQGWKFVPNEVVDHHSDPLLRFLYLVSTLSHSILSRCLVVLLSITLPVDYQVHFSDCPWSFKTTQFFLVKQTNEQTKSQQKWIFPTMFHFSNFYFYSHYLLSNNQLPILGWRILLEFHRKAKLENTHIDQDRQKENPRPTPHNCPTGFKSAPFWSYLHTCSTSWPIW